MIDRGAALHREDDPHGGYVEGELDAEGRRQGRWTHYGSDGRVRSEFHYEAGQLHGDAVWYRATGGMLQRGGFDQEEKNGYWQRWTADGTLIDEGHYDRGVKSGEWVYYAPDGTVRKTTQHRGR